MSGDLVSIINGGARGAVSSSIFASNESLVPSSTVLLVAGGPIDFIGNIVYGVKRPETTVGAVVMGGFVGLPLFDRNVVAGCDGGPAVQGAPVGGCNLVWENPGGHFKGREPGENDMVASPQFCDPEGGDFSVAQSSPCLGTNNLLACSTLGSVVGGCPSTGQIPHILTTDPTGLAVVVDGELVVSPELVVWGVGTDHLLSTSSPQQSIPDTRYAFQGWSDGCDTTHVVVASDQAVEFCASFETEHWLATTGTENGLVFGAGWYVQGLSLRSKRYRGLATSLSDGRGPEKVPTPGQITINRHDERADHPGRDLYERGPRIDDDRGR